MINWILTQSFNISLHTNLQGDMATDFVPLPSCDYDFEIKLLLIVLSRGVKGGFLARKKSAIQKSEVSQCLI